MSTLSQWGHQMSPPHCRRYLEHHKISPQELVLIYQIIWAGSQDGSSSMVALQVNSHIVCGFFLSWLGGPPQSFECSIWDCVGFYMIHTFLDPSAESQFRIISKSYNFLFGTTTTQSFTFSTSHFFSGQSWHASSSSIVLYLWLGARRPTAQLYDSGMVSRYYLG